MGGANYTRTPPPISAHNFHTVVCRWQPAWAIDTKMVLSGFESDFEFHQSPLSSFPRKRESRGGAGGANGTRILPSTSAPNFHTLVCRRWPAWPIATELTRAVSHQTKIDPGRTLGQCQIPKATGELQFARINS